jgi:hypothetical protein
MHVFQSVAEARVVLAVYRRHYNEERPHSSLGYRTPAEFKRDWIERHLPTRATIEKIANAMQCTATEKAELLAAAGSFPPR